MISKPKARSVVNAVAVVLITVGILVGLVYNTGAYLFIPNPFKSPRLVRLQLNANEPLTGHFTSLKYSIRCFELKQTGNTFQSQFISEALSAGIKSIDGKVDGKTGLMFLENEDKLRTEQEIELLADGIKVKDVANNLEEIFSRVSSCEHAKTTFPRIDIAAEDILTEEDIAVLPDLSGEWIIKDEAGSMGGIRLVKRGQTKKSYKLTDVSGFASMFLKEGFLEFTKKDDTGHYEGVLTAIARSLGGGSVRDVRFIVETENKMVIKRHNYDATPVTFVRK